MAEVGDLMGGEVLHLRAYYVDECALLFREAAHVGGNAGSKGHAFLAIHKLRERYDLVECAVDPVPALRDRAEVDGVVREAGDGHSALAVRQEVYVEQHLVHLGLEGVAHLVQEVKEKVLHTCGGLGGEAVLRAPGAAEQLAYGTLFVAPGARLADHFLHSGGNLGELFVRKLMARTANQVQEDSWIHRASDHLAVALTRDFALFVHPVLIDPEAEDGRHLRRAETIPFTQSDDFVGIWDAVLGAILIGHLIEPDSVTFSSGITLPFRIVAERDVHAIVLLAPEFQ